MPVATAEAVAAALDELGPIGAAGVALGPMTTYRVGGPAAVFARPISVADLAAVARAVRSSGLPLLVVGRGSNLLVADRGHPGIAVTLAGLEGGDRIELDHPERDASATVTAGGAVLLPVLARRTAAAGLAGFEWAVGVPGSVGGAVRMNAGGHGSDMAASLIDVDVVDLAAPGSGEPAVRRLPASELGLGFRSSALTSSQVVLGARLRLAPGDRVRSERVLAEIVAWRRAHQPGGQNAGSVFVNPVPGEVSAGQLIDQLGLRGLRLGTAWVSEKHANFIQAADGGSADDVFELMRVVRERVERGTGYVLRSEIRLVGFDHQLEDAVEADPT